MSHDLNEIQVELAESQHLEEREREALELERFAAMVDRWLLREKTKTLSKIYSDRSAGASAGGMASAINKDDAILRALKKYKSLNPDDKMTKACRCIVDEGGLCYENENKLLARLSRMGRRMSPSKRPRDIYDSL